MPPRKQSPKTKTSGSSFLAAQGFLNADGTPKNKTIAVDKPKVCHNCGSDDFWKNRAGEWICHICHPQYRPGVAPSKENIEIK